MLMFSFFGGFYSTLLRCQSSSSWFSFLCRLYRVSTASCRHPQWKTSVFSSHLSCVSLVSLSVLLCRGVSWAGFCVCVCVLSLGLHAIKADRKRQAAWRPYCCSSFTLTVKHTLVYTHTHTHAASSYCMLMIPALGTFVSGLTTHTLHTLSFFHSRHCATNSPWIPSTFGSRLPGLSVKRFLWNSNRGLVIVNKGDIDWQVSTEECGHREWWLGGERVDDPHQSVSRCQDYSAAGCGVSSGAFRLSSHQI